jgi:hypothetical protein
MTDERFPSWVKTEVGYVLASEIAAVVIEERSSTYFRASKGYEEEIEWRVLVVVTKGGAKLDVADERFGMPGMEGVERLVEIVDAIVTPYFVESEFYREGS